MLVVEGAPLSVDERRCVDAYWRAASYLSAGQICLMANLCVSRFDPNM